MTDTDDGLVRRAIAGDRCALAELIRQWDERVFSVAYRILGDWNDALDVRQQTFERMLGRLPYFDPEGHFAAWLYRIIVNLCRDRHRAHLTTARVMADLRRLSATEARTGNPKPPGDGPSAVRDAVLALPPDEREVTVLRHYASLTFAEMAAILDVPASTLKSRSLRALRRLRAELSGLEDRQQRGEV